VGPHTIRVRLPESGDLGWDDLVFGKSGQDASEIGDRIIQRSDGQPLYHLAVVVDDLEMGITHVIRGADHHPNTPLQIALYRALEAKPPEFAHVPLIVAAGGKKLSKRRDPVSVQNFREEGYLAPALRNWLIRIGWSHGDQEVFSSDEICALFDLGAVNRSAARADGDKLLWLNQHYLKELPASSLAEMLAPFLSAEVGREVPVNTELAALAELQRERGKTLSEMARLSRWFAVEEVDFDAKAVAKHLKPTVEPALRALRDGFAKLDSWSSDAIEAVFLNVLSAQGDMKIGKLAQPVRVAVTGGSVSPGIFETLEVLGQERALARIERALELIGVA
jgi:glutamyl-tRNA synthetase